MLTFVNNVSTEPIYYSVVLFMKTILRPQKKELDKVYAGKKEENEPDEVRINVMLSGYFVWLMNNNIEEFQMFYKFWNPIFADQSLVLR